MLLLDTWPQEHEKSFEMHPANEPVFEPVLTSAVLSSNQVKPQEMHCIDFSECNPDTQTEQNENLIKRAEIRNPIVSFTSSITVNILVKSVYIEH